MRNQSIKRLYSDGNDNFDVIIFNIAFLFLNVLLQDVDLTDPSTKDEPYDYRFVKWLIKEKVSQCIVFTDGLGNLLIL